MTGVLERAFLKGEKISLGYFCNFTTAFALVCAGEEET
jgi:hypothetical protein